MPRLNIELKLKVVRLHREGHRQCDIVRILQNEHDFKIGRRHLGRFIRDYEATGELRKVNSKRRPLIKQTNEILQFVDSVMEKNYETTATDLAKMIREQFLVDISETTIRRTRRKLGWLYRQEQNTASWSEKPTERNACDFAKIFSQPMRNFRTSYLPTKVALQWSDIRK